MSALFFDIDGTILSEITHEIPESALVALRKAQENGHKTFINTGRTICSVPPMIKRIPFDGFLCGCGTHLVYEERIVFHHSIPYMLKMSMLSLELRISVKLQDRQLLI